MKLWQHGWLLIGLSLGGQAAESGNALPRTTPARDPVNRVIKVLVIDYDPILKDHGNVRLSRFLKWNDPRSMTTNLMRYLREASGGFADYRLVEFIEVDAFPRKRDGFRYDEQSFLAMWKDRKLAHQPDSVSYAAIFEEHQLAERVRRRASRKCGFGARRISARMNTR